MESIRYSIAAATDTGSFLDRVKVSRLSLGRSVNTWGVLEFETADSRFLSRDIRFTVWRSRNNEQPQKVTNTPFLLRKVVREYRQGRWIYTVIAFSALHLIARRIIAHYAGTAGALTDGYIRAAIKQIVDDIFTNNAWETTYRSNGVQVLLPIGEFTGPQTEKGYAWRPALTVIQELAEDAAQLGSPLYFDVVELDTGELLFEVFPDQRGSDRRYGVVATPTILSPDRRNLTDIRITEDYTEEVTAVYAGGEGEGANRLIHYTEDPTRQTASIFNHIEAFEDQRNAETTAELASEARSRLEEGKPRLSLSAKIVPTFQTQFMRDFDFGDRVTAQVEQQTYDCMLNTLKIDYASGVETIDARINLG